MVSKYGITTKGMIWNMQIPKMPLSHPKDVTTQSNRVRRKVLKSSSMVLFNNWNWINEINTSWYFGCRPAFVYNEGITMLGLQSNIWTISHSWYPLILKKGSNIFYSFLKHLNLVWSMNEFSVYSKIKIYIFSFRCLFDIDIQWLPDII